MRSIFIKSSTLVIISLFSSVAWGGPLEEIVNSKFPPVSPDQQRSAAVKTAIDTLNAFPDINLAAHVSLKDAVAVIAARPELQKFGIKSFELRGGGQILDAVITLDKSLDGSVIPAKYPQLKALFDKVSPQAKARISIGLTMESAFLGATKDQTAALSIQLLPVFRSIKVEALTIPTGTLGELLGQNKIDVTSAADSLVGWINGYANQISGALTHLEVAKIIIPSSPLPAQDVNRTIQVSAKDDAKISVKLTGNPVSSPVRLAATALMIDSEDITVLAKLSPPAETPPKSQATGNVTYSFPDLKHLVLERVHTAFKISGWPEYSWVAVTKAQVAGLLNSSFLQAHLCVSASSDIPKQEFSKKINMPSEKKIDCTPTKKCDQPHDERNCRKCAFRVCVNDPVCETAKATQNRIYDANKGACEVEKSSTKLTCESGKEAVSLLAHTGNFANIDGSFGTGSATLTACFQNVVFSPSLNKVDLSLLVGGQGSADTSIKFTPLDIVGHLTCQAPWTQSKRVSINLASQPLAISANVKQPRGQSGNLVYALEIQTSSLAAKIQPSPRNLILTSYNMDIACAPAALLVNSVTFSAAPFVPELAGDVHLPGQQLSLSYELKPVQFNIGGTNGTMDFSDNDAALIAKAKVK